MTEEKLEFTRRLLIMGNLGLVTWSLLCVFAVVLYNQTSGWLYLIFETFMVYVILRRLGCSTVITAKLARKGLAGFQGLFFGKGYVKKESVGNRIELVGFVYCLLHVIPALALVLLLLQAFSLFAVLALVGVLTLGVYSLATWFRPTAHR